jgi:hypothetical protein
VKERVAYLRAFLRVPLGCSERGTSGPFCGFSQGANYPHETRRPSRLSTVSPFGPLGPTPDLLQPPRRIGLRRPDPHRRIGRPFRLRLIGRGYPALEAGATWGDHRSVQQAIFLRRDRQAPRRSVVGIRISGDRSPLIQGNGTQGFATDGRLAHRPGRNAAPPEAGVSLLGLFDTAGEAALATYPRRSRGSSNDFRTGTDPHG